MRAKLAWRRRSARTVFLENLERRLVLAGDVAVEERAPCLLEVSASGEAARAAQAINCFAIELYEQLQHERGNLLLSPLSIATALAMTYAGAAGETATEMEQVLHLGSEPGIHESFAALLSSLETAAGAAQAPQLELANALWPDERLTLRNDFVRTIETDYHGAAQSLDYANLDQAKDTINAWVEEKTHGRIQDLIKELDPNTSMVLTNSIYFKSIWETPLNPEKTYSEFYRAGGEWVETSMMSGALNAPYTRLEDFQVEVLELPLEGGKASMVFILPDVGPDDMSPANELTSELLVAVNNWLENLRPVDFGDVNVVLPKFTTTVSTQLEDLLPEMGMSSAFGAADFSKMFEVGGGNIKQVGHKAFLEVNEQGAEASAATDVDIGLCFAAGTLVLTPNGEKPIEQLQAGDYVFSRDEHDVQGKIEPKVVEETFCSQAEIVLLHVGGQVLRVTKEHRFFKQDGGWTAAGELRAGDLLASDLSSWLEVEQVTAPGNVVPVYNFQVADHHTYFVGSQAWGFAVWTHNRGCCGDARCFVANSPFQFLIRDNASSTLLFMGRMDDPTQTENELTPSATPIPGDSNHDGRFDSTDLVLAFQAGKYEDDIADNANFEEGDWNGDGDFTTTDLIFAFQNTVYERAAAARLLLPQIAASLFPTDQDEILRSAVEGMPETDSNPLDAIFAELVHTQ